VDAEAGRRLVLDDEALDLVVRDIARPDDGDVAPGRVADPPLLTVENPDVALALRRRGQPTGGAGTHERLSKPEAADFLQSRHRREPLLLLLFRTVDVNRAHRQTGVHTEERRERRVGASDLPLNKTQQRETSTRTSIALKSNPADAQLFDGRQ